MLWRRRDRRKTIERLYGAIVAQARLPVFYTDFAVPDTIDGRFDLIVLHVHLLYRRLAAEGDEYRVVGQDVFDRFIEDMDASLREIGVGDLAVPKRMRAMGQAFYGRAAAYDAALAMADDRELAAALQRNLYGGGDTAEAARRLAHYVRSATADLARRDARMIASGELRFPRPDE